MDRVKVSVPDTINFYAYLTIRITDLNYGGHVGNDVFLSLIHEARVQYLRSFGYSEMDFAGVGLIMVDAAIEFKRELIYGNEIRIGVIATAFDKIGFDIFYFIEVRSGDEWQPCGKVKTGMLCFDYSARKKVAIPVAALEKLNK